MRKFAAYLFLTVVLFTVDGMLSHAQTRQSIDTDIRTLCRTAAPGYRNEADDYLRFAPGALTLGMKIGGYEGRTKWGGMLVSDAFSVGIMAGVSYGLKYTIRRTRPDGSGNNSFPSGHTATAFMTATMLHKEYGWRSPWFSIGGYTVAAATGVSRMLNDKHWMSDVAAGAAIGIGSVQLGYFITDKIFKSRHLTEGFEQPEFHYDSSVKHYTAELLFGRRFIFGNGERKDAGILPSRGSVAGVQTDIPVIAGTGVSFRATGSSLTYSDGRASDLYCISAGGWWNWNFAKILELQPKISAGWAYSDGGHGVNLGAGIGLSLIIDSNFKIKGFAEYDTVSRPEGWLHSALVGYSVGWFW